MNEPEAFLDGRFIPARDAAVSIGDAGFVLGATVAEQLRTFGGQLFRLEAHLARLEQSLRIVGIEPGMTMDRFAEVGRELVGRNHRLLDPGDDLGLSIFVTPGPYAAFSPSAAEKPTVCLHTYPLPFRSWAEKYERGESLVVTDVRQVSPRSWPPELKCRSRMHYYLADRRAAAAEPGGRALLLDEDGLVTETSTANVLVFNAHEGLISPPPERILRGISLSVACELARGLGIPTGRRDLRPEDIASAEEVLLVSTPFCLLPVTCFNGRPIGQCRPGDVFGRLLAAWSASVGVDLAAQARRFAERAAQ